MFAIKSDIKNMSENRKFWWENDIKLAQDAHFAIFFLSKNHCFERKTKNVF